MGHGVSKGVITLACCWVGTEAAGTREAKGTREGTGGCQIKDWGWKKPKEAEQKNTGSGSWLL